MPDAALVGEIRRLLEDSPFHGEGYRKLWARLRFAGIRTSRRRVLRLAREHGLLAHQRPRALKCEAAPTLCHPERAAVRVWRE